MSRFTALARLLLVGAAAGCLSLATADEPKAKEKVKGKEHPANRLAKETSPYLLLHAHNPVDWFPWGPEAFERAKKEQKPIFLSVGYSSCYWCHVMERECFQDEAIAKLMNEHFVCVKVDREERPDVDGIYMTALQAFGSGGGWPMSMFLTPDGKPFYGGTYFPPAARDGMPAFPTVLKGVADAWRDERKEVVEAADRLTEGLRRALASGEARRRVPLSRDMAARGRVRLAAQYDAEYGGFGYEPDNPRRPKFPEPVNLVFLLDQERRHFAGPVARRILDEQKDQDPLAMVVGSMDHMARGGIRDHLAGGYHRYSVNRAWTVPHFEKMLYDNAQLATAHLLAFETTGDARWRREAEDTFAFVARSLTDPAGGFYSALDAETGGEEGGYYVWSRAEVEKLLGKGDDFRIFAAVYGLDGEPNFEGGRYVLNVRAGSAEALKLSPEALEARLAPLRAKLLAVRDKRPAPLRDEKVLTSWNGLMIAAYAEGYRVLKEPRYRAAADRAADYLLATHKGPDGRLLRTSRDGKAKLPAYLEDYAFLADGLLRLHAATGDPKRLAQARELADRMIADFADRKQGGFFYTAEGHESLLARTKDPFDNAIPSGNSVAIRVLVALGKLTSQASYLDEAGRALDAFSPSLFASPHGLPLMLTALSEYLDLRPAAATEPSDGLPGGPASRMVIGVAALAPGAKATPGSELKVALALTIKDGWHIYANPVGGEGLKPTVLTLGEGKGATLTKVTYPAGESKKLAGAGEKVAVYEGDVTLTAFVRVDEAVRPGAVELPFRVRYQACNDRACLAPATLDIPLKLEITPR